MQFLIFSYNYANLKIVPRNYLPRVRRVTKNSVRYRKISNPPQHTIRVMSATGKDTMSEPHAARNGQNTCRARAKRGLACPMAMGTGSCATANNQSLHAVGEHVNTKNEEMTQRQCSPLRRSKSHSVPHVRSTYSFNLICSARRPTVPEVVRTRGAALSGPEDCRCTPGTTTRSENCSCGIPTVTVLLVIPSTMPRMMGLTTTKETRRIKHNTSKTSRACHCRAATSAKNPERRASTPANPAKHMQEPQPKLSAPPQNCPAGAYQGRHQRTEPAQRLPDRKGCRNNVRVPSANRSTRRLTPYTYPLSSQQALHAETTLEVSNIQHRTCDCQEREAAKRSVD